ncbi:MAG: pyridoxamine 5'-phosphate oxidase family protein [Candidatus Kariarchaeaceae archaeon]
MRRDEFTSSDAEDFNFITQNAIVGYLGLISKSGYPRIIPLNFTAIDQTVYFHGALEGEKYEILMENPKVSFSVDVPYSFIPSHFQSKKSACPATHFFKSLHIRGKGVMVSDVQEKSDMFNYMMKKYQPEGRYVKLSPDEQMYKKPLLDVGVFKVIPDEITMKIKFGQNMPQTKFDQVISSLTERGTKLDRATIVEMSKRYPKN